MAGDGSPHGLAAPVLLPFLGFIAVLLGCALILSSCGFLIDSWSAKAYGPGTAPTITGIPIWAGAHSGWVRVRSQNPDSSWVFLTPTCSLYVDAVGRVSGTWVQIPFAQTLLDSLVDLDLAGYAESHVTLTFPSDAGLLVSLRLYRQINSNIPANVIVGNWDSYVLTEGKQSMATPFFQDVTAGPAVARESHLRDAFGPSHGGGHSGVTTRGPALR